MSKTPTSRDTRILLVMVERPDRRLTTVPHENM
jgi:hypothetical protein